MRGGYGFISNKGDSRVVHRVSWELTFGPITEGMKVCHSCDNPPCVRPTHLFLGSQAENLSDMRQKGRGRSGDDHWTHRNPEKVKRGADHWTSRKSGRSPRGEAVKGSKLTDDQVREIRRLRAEGVLLKDLAARFHVAIGTVHFIVTGQTWRHLL